MSMLPPLPHTTLSSGPSLDSALIELSQAQRRVRACQSQVTRYPSKDQRMEVENCAIAVAVVKSALEGTRDEELQRDLRILERDYRCLANRVACLSRLQAASLPSPQLAPSLAPSPLAPSLSASSRPTTTMPRTLPSMPTPVIFPKPAPTKREGNHTPLIAHQAHAVHVPALSISSSSSLHPSLSSTISLSSSSSSTASSSSSSSSSYSDFISDQVALTFASIKRERTKGPGITIGNRIQLSQVFHEAAPVTVPSLLDRTKTGAARSLLLGPKGQGYALMVELEEGDPLINRGGFKELYHAVGLHDGGDYAVAVCDIAKVAARKSMEKSVVKAFLVREQFFAEYLLGVPGIINIPLVAEANGKFYFIMKLYRGGDFSQLLDNLQGYTVELPFQHRVGRELLLALAATHTRDVVHRDLKPQNILLDEDLHAVLCDYGLATLADDPDRLGAGRFVGTTEFWAPETAKGIPPSSKAVDIWAMGIILYNLITLQPMPWQVRPKGQPASVTIQNIPQDMSWKPSFPSSPYPRSETEAAQMRELQKIVSDMLQIDPKKRPSIQEVLHRWNAVISR